MFRISMKMNQQTTNQKAETGELPPGARVDLTVECATVGDLMRVLGSRYESWGCIDVSALGKAHRKEVDALEGEIEAFIERHPL